MKKINRSIHPLVDRCQEIARRFPEGDEIRDILLECRNYIMEDIIKLNQWEDQVQKLHTSIITFKKSRNPQ